jgi:hypothetical protein
MIFINSTITVTYHVDRYGYSLCADGGSLTKSLAIISLGRLPYERRTTASFFLQHLSPLTCGEDLQNQQERECWQGIYQLLQEAQEWDVLRLLCMG